VGQAVSAAPKPPFLSQTQLLVGSGPGTQRRIPLGGSKLPPAGNGGREQGARPAAAWPSSPDGQEPAGAPSREES